MHLLCSEAYVVVEGLGRVQTLTWRDGFQETPLLPGNVVTFTPGTIHRLINTDGELRIVVIMANSGLPEAGDAVFTFPSPVLADPADYLTRAKATAVDEVKQRRDLAIAGFHQLRAAGREGLAAFHEAAIELIATRLDEFENSWRTGALAAAEETGAQLAQLRKADGAHLRDATVTRLTSQDAFGMCGHLHRYAVPGATR
jgi:hypothetical protein